MLRHADHVALVVFDVDRIGARPEVEPVHRLVVLAHVVVALGRARVVVERDAGADDVDEGRALVRDRRFHQGNELLLVAGEAARDEGGAHDKRERHGVHRLVRVHLAALRL